MKASDKTGKRQTKNAIFMTKSWYEIATADKRQMFGQ
jgi:hypothetical protein